MASGQAHRCGVGEGKGAEARGSGREGFLEDRTPPWRVSRGDGGSEGHGFQTKEQHMQRPGCQRELGTLGDLKAYTGESTPSEARWYNKCKGVGGETGRL